MMHEWVVLRVAKEVGEGYGRPLIAVVLLA